MRSSVSRINHFAGLQLRLANGFKGAGLGSKMSNNTGSNVISSIRCHSTMLAEVGRFEIRQPDGICYPAGQPFLHRIFGYRGVILFPWLAKVNDIDIRKQCSDDSMESHGQHGNYLTQVHPYYQVLIDARDCPFVLNRTQTEVTGSVAQAWILGQPGNSDKSVVGSIKGLDYVAHEDILPYTSHEEQPIQHELHNRLFKYDPDAIPLGGSKFKPTERLDRWQKKHHCLDLSRVYRETTENIRVTVIPFYLGHATVNRDTYWWWRYSVRLENFSDANVQLLERHWKIFSQTNMLQTIKGRGVVGSEPLLTKNEPAFQYSSHVNLQDKSGHMWGTFKMQRVDGYTFECRIPAFSLESSLDLTTTPAGLKHNPLDDDGDGNDRV